MLLGKRQFRVSESNLMSKIAAMGYLSESSPLPPPPPPPPPPRSECCPTTTSARKLPSKSGCRLGCTRTLLAGNSSTSLAGSEEQQNFPSNLPKCLKWLQKLHSCFVIVFRSGQGRYFFDNITIFGQIDISLNGQNCFEDN